MSMLFYFLLSAVDAWAVEPKSRSIIRSEETVPTISKEATVPALSRKEPTVSLPVTDAVPTKQDSTKQTDPVPTGNIVPQKQEFGWVPRSNDLVTAGPNPHPSDMQYTFIGLCIVLAVSCASFVGFRYKPDQKGGFSVVQRQRTNTEYLLKGYVHVDESECCPFEEGSEIGKLSVSAAVFSLITTMVGAGILAFPSIAKACGWYFTPFVVVGAGLVSLGSSRMFAEVMERTGEYGNYAAVVSKCLGARAGVAAEFIMLGFLFGMASICLVLIGENLDFLVPWSTRGWVLVTGVVMAGTSLMQDISLLAKLSAIGVLAAVLYIICICGGAISAASTYDEELRPHGRHWPDSGLTVISNFAVCMFGYTCSQMLPVLRRDLKNPQELGKASAVTHFLVMSVYLLVALVGYYGWGDAAQSMILLSMCGNPGCEGNLDLSGSPKATISAANAGARSGWGFILAAAVVANLAVTLPLVNYVMFQGLGERFETFKSTGLAGAAGRISMVLAASLIAIFTPYFKELLGILSSTFVVGIQVLMPAASCFQLDRAEGKTRYDALLFLAVGVVVLVVGLYGACSDFAAAIQEEGDQHGFWHSKWRE